MREQEGVIPLFAIKSVGLVTSPPIETILDGYYDTREEAQRVINVRISPKMTSRCEVVEVDDTGREVT